MLLDEKSLKIMAKSFDWDEAQINDFVYAHATTLMSMTKGIILGTMADEEPEKLEEIDKMTREQNVQSRVNAMKALEDQIQMAVIKYPDLQKKIEEKTNEFDRKVFFDFLKYGPVDGALELLQHMQDKVELFDDYDRVVEILKTKLGEDQINQVLSSRS